MRPIRIGTRGSALALWQARTVAALLEQGGADVEIAVIRTAGDRLQQAPLSEVGGKRLDDPYRLVPRMPAGARVQDCHVTLDTQNASGFLRTLGAFQRLGICGLGVAIPGRHVRAKV